MEPNYYAGGGFLNRLGWMRPSAPFLRSALASPKARVLLYNDLNPLIRFPPDALSLDTSHDGIATLASVPFSSVIAHLPSPSSSPEDIVGDEGTLWPSQLSKRAEADAPLDAFPTLVFLGADERDVDDRPFRATKDAAASELELHTKGSPVWALDVSSIPALADVSQTSALLANPVEQGEELDFADMRAGMMSLRSTEANIAGTGRALLDWHRRHRYCPGCGRPTHAVWGGWKRQCTEDAEPHADEGRRKGGRPPCISRRGVHNFSYPRTDPVSIMAVISADEDALLLGRQRSWPKGFYSCLAGFIEPGESLEDAVKREVMEEAGIAVDHVRYHSSQPWPYPGSVMLGAVAFAAPNAQIRLDFDNELEDARWVSREAVLRALGSRSQSGLTRQEIDKLDSGRPGTPPRPSSAADSSDELRIRMPPRTAIAHTLISAWAHRSKGWDGSSGGNTAASQQDDLVSKM